MKIAVFGLWHLGSVTAACLAQKSYEVIGIDADPTTIDSLKNGHAPLFEPGLDELIASGLSNGKLLFTSDFSHLHDVDIVWITIDTPVDDQDIADIHSVTTAIESLFPFLKENTLLLISSQVPVGTARQLLKKCHNQFPTKNISFAVSPENLRLGKAIQVFNHPDRIVIGIQSEQDKKRITELLQPFTDHLIWMSIESAEMTKHALNAFLATSVVFINELAVLCEQVGADARQVEKGLKTEERIGTKAYLKPGTAIAGGTLARDVNFLSGIAKEYQVKTPLFSSLLESNQLHKQWSCNRVLALLKDLRNKNITALGLTYKPGTNTLRRSSAIETCLWLHQQGANVLAFDPALKLLPNDLKQAIDLKSSLEDALAASDCVIVATECPEFTTISSDNIVKYMRHPCVIDANGFLMKTLQHDQRIEYFTVGSMA